MNSFKRPLLGLVTSLFLTLGWVNAAEMAAKFAGHPAAEQVAATDVPAAPSCALCSIPLE